MTPAPSQRRARPAKASPAAVTVSCRLCGGESSNPQGWPICRGCYDGGRYYRWVVGELEGGNTDPKMLEAYHFMRRDRGLMQLLHYPPEVKL